MLEHLFKLDCIVKRPVTVGTLNDKNGDPILDGGTPAKIKEIEISERDLSAFNLTANNTAYLIKGLDSIPRGSQLIFNNETYDLDKIKALRNIYDMLEGFKVFV